MIQYKVGDLFENLPDNKIIVIPHVCNDVGAFGGGFVVPLARNFPTAKIEYQKEINMNQFLEKRSIGLLNTVVAEDNEHRKVIVENMIAQTGLINANNPRPLKYWALVKCMLKVARNIRMMSHSMINVDNREIEIHAPKFGSCLAGGDFSFIKILIEEIWGDFDVTIYSLE